MSVREENLNTELAGLLVDRGLGATAEVKLHIGRERKLPDVLMLVNGVKVIVEGKYDGSSAQSQLEEQCIKRIEKGLSEVAVGIIYASSKISSEGILIANQRQIRDLLKRMPLSIKIWRYGETENGSGWNTLSIDGLASAIRDAVNNVASEDTLARAVALIEQGVDKMASELLDL